MAKKRYFLAFFCCFPNLNPKSCPVIALFLGEENYSEAAMMSQNISKTVAYIKTAFFQKKTGLYKGKVCCHLRLDSARLEAQKLGSPKARWFASSARQKLGNDQARTSLFLRGNHATSVSDGLSGRIVAVSESDPGSTFHYPGSIEVRLFDIRCTTKQINNVIFSTCFKASA